MLSGSERLSALENGGVRDAWPAVEGGPDDSQLPPYPGYYPQQSVDKPPDQEKMKKPTRRPGAKPPPDRAKRSIFCFSLKNPIRQWFIQVSWSYIALFCIFAG